MLNKRIIGVLPVIDNMVVQSVGYSRYFPIGKPEIAMENLERWGVDEILILCLDRSRNCRGPNFDLMNKISSCGFRTPLTYGGGISNPEEAVQFIKAGCERIVLDAMIDDIEVVRGVAERIGAQAVIGCLPAVLEIDQLKEFDYLKNKTKPLGDNFKVLLKEGLLSEILLIDKINEGTTNAFDYRLLESAIKNFRDCSFICFGGISNPEIGKRILETKEVVAIGIGNSLNYKEHAVQNIKKNIVNVPIRGSIFSKSGLDL